MNDKELRQKIIDELNFEPSVDAASIGVLVDQGIVTLTGHVRHYSEKMMVERAVQRVKGVRGVAQEIEIRYPTGKQVADDQIAARALSIIAWDASLPEDRIHVHVERGWVTLTGTVEWNYQRLFADQAVRKLSGVMGVSNLLEVEPVIAMGDVKHRIEDALKRSAEVEAERIRVAVNAGTVVLEGVVHSWHERDAAERAAWAVPGVTHVDDRLSIA